MKCFFNLLIVICVATVLGENCDQYGVLIYEDLGCIPKNPQPGKCPEKFTCPNLYDTLRTCTFRGEVYHDGTPVDRNVSIRSCQTGCYCETKFGNVPGYKFRCGKLDCPEKHRLAPAPGCHLTYGLDECCSVGRLCEPFDEIATCEVDGKTYKEGELFWPKDTCLTCVCKKGFAGKLEAPFCRRQDCGTQISDNNRFIGYRCAPLYFSNSTLCCPDHWACPDGTEQVEGTPTEPEKSLTTTLVPVSEGNEENGEEEEFEETSAEDDENDCTWDNYKVKVGQYIIKTNVGTFPHETKLKKVRCDCVLPPLLTCRPA